MGAVFLAEDTQLRRRVALKVLHPQVGVDPKHAARFLQEARAASRLGHPGVVHIYEFGTTAQGQPFLAMEFLEGETLEARLARGPLSCDQALPLLCQVADALTIAHRLGLVHRDLKPSNLFLTPDTHVRGGQRVKLLDFGLVKWLAPEVWSLAPLTTRSGVIQGTPPYMAPEQCQPSLAPITGAVDVYAFGLLCYRVLAGRLPFHAEDPMGWMLQQVSSPPPALDRVAPQVPRALCALVMTLLAKAPADRPTMAAAAAALAEWQAEGRVGARPALSPGRRSLMLWPVVTALAVLSVAAVVKGVFRRDNQRSLASLAVAASDGLMSLGPREATASLSPAGRAAVSEAPSSAVRAVRRSVPVSKQPAPLVPRERGVGRVNERSLRFLPKALTVPVQEHLRSCIVRHLGAPPGQTDLHLRFRRNELRPAERFLAEGPAAAWRRRLALEGCVNQRPDGLSEDLRVEGTQ